MTTSNDSKGKGSWKTDLETVLALRADRDAWREECESQRKLVVALRRENARLKIELDNERQPKLDV